MLDKYILLNSKINKSLKYSIILLLILLILFIIIIFRIKLNPYLVEKAKIEYIENNYYLKLNVTIDKLNIISSKKKMYINKRIYKYVIYKIKQRKDNNIVLINVYKLPNSLKINNYPLIIKIKEDKKGIIDYLKEGDK